MYDNIIFMKLKNIAYNNLIQFLKWYYFETKWEIIILIDNIFRFKVEAFTYKHRDLLKASYACHPRFNSFKKLKLLISYCTKKLYC